MKKREKAEDPVVAKMEGYFRQTHRKRLTATQRRKVERMRREQRGAEVQKARKVILDTANKHRSKDLKSFGKRHIQQAVHHVRQHQLVKPEVLKRAGYR